MRFNPLFKREHANNCIGIIFQLLKVLNVPVTRTTVANSLQEHPEYPGLLTITDSLKKWKVENMVIQVNGEKLKELPVPFVAHVGKGKQDYVIVTGVSDKTVTYSTHKRSHLNIAKQDFEKNWSGVVVLIDVRPGAGEITYAENRKKERLRRLRNYSAIIWFSILSLSFLTFLIGTLPAPTLLLVIALLVLDSIGIIITCYLVSYEIDREKFAKAKICGKSKSLNCFTVLDSSGAKLFGVISWSEIGLFYFTGTLLGFVFATGHLHTYLYLLSVLSLLPLPFTAFSFYYQGKVLKKWCRLCLAIQLILIVEAGLLYFSSIQFTSTFLLDPVFIASVTAAFGLPVIVYTFIKPGLQAIQQRNEYRKKYSLIKYNKTVFSNLLYQQKQLISTTLGIGIRLGNPTAENIITTVSSPYCPSCAKSYTEINRLLNDNKNVQVQIIFAPADDDDRLVEPIMHLMYIYEKGDPMLITEALKDWYNNRNYQLFSRKYKLNAELHQQEKKLQEMSQWCQKNNIEYTPAIFFNGYQLPLEYQTEDLNYFLNEN